jgi:2-oxoglutarate dehydrogenase E2 component (dihydrolipoamide succinyltransferase)
MATTVDVTMPSEQSEGTESVVATWFKAVGERVEQNEPLLEISTDKVNMEVAAPVSGVLTEILKQEGEQIEPGTLLGRIEIGGAGGDGEGGKRVESSPQADGSEKTRSGESGTSSGGATVSSDLSPAVRKLIREHRLEASQITGSGKGGRITHQDVMHFVAHRPGQKKSAPRASGISGRMVPHNQMRRSIAQHMVQSVATAPHVTSVFEADLSRVIAHREANKSDFEARGAKLTYTTYFVKAAVDGIRAVPETNSRWHDDALEIFDDVNIGIATALAGGGLIVPVIMKAHELNLFAIAQKLGDLTTRARNEKLEAKDVQNGTFTISNHGVSGSLVATPIVINQPQSAILGVGKLQHRAMVDRAEVVVKPMCYVTLTIDHRVLDGFQANQFLTAFVKSLEDE